MNTAANLSFAITVVDQNSASWNRITTRLRAISQLRDAA
jgi:hypothetical protein